MYYDGTKLLSLKDMNGNMPELYVCTTNRSGGKTTYFSRLLVNRFLKNNKKFGLIYRYNYELSDVSEKFFSEIKKLFFPNWNMIAKNRGKGIFVELFLVDKNGVEYSCGYAISLNSADGIKKYSHLLNDIDSMLFDEFQSETNKYCTDEVRKFLSVHTSVSRGNGKQVRYVPVYMLSNQVSILNPYYTELGIGTRLTKKTKFLKGDGFVLESGFIESASLAQKESGVNRAFHNNKYVEYSSENIYLNDMNSFVEKIEGYRGKYMVTLRYKGKDYGIRIYDELGVVYCNDSVDTTFSFKISVTTEDHTTNYVMLKKNDLYLSLLRYYFEHGCFRFKDFNCKEVVLKALSY